MPTGYTDAIKNGITFNEFVWSCARAFGALIMMRDDASDAPIPKFQPSTYNADRLLVEEVELAALLKMTPAEADAAALAVYEAEYKQVEKWNQEKVELLKKYEQMLASVTAWEPPTPEHSGLKKFMAEQIQQSIDFDCRPSELPEPQRGKVWLENKVASTRRSIEYHREENIKEIDRTDGRNEWVEALDKSVPRPTKLKAAA